MTSAKLFSIWNGQKVGLTSILIPLLAGFCFSQPAVRLSPKQGPPTSRLLVSGSGYSPYAAIDIYFDTKDEALAVADGSGSFSKIAIHAPASALPGRHWVSAVQRAGAKGAQEPFWVNTNWSQFHFDADGTRLNPYENVLNPKTVGSLDLKWSYFDLDDNYASPVVANGVVYFSCGFGSGSVSVCAVNARTGTLLWSYNTNGNVLGLPAVANGVVYVGSDSPFNEGTMYALNAKTGALLWSYGIGDGYGFVSSPAVADGVVYIPSACDGGCAATLYALNAKTGALLWSYPFGGATSSPAVADGVVYVGSTDENVYALNASTGVKLWNYTTSGTVSSSPAVANGVVYVGTFYYVYALSATTGAVLWSYTTGGYVYSSPAVANGVVYVGCTESICALNATTGAKLWNYNTSGTVFSSPAVANGVVYVGCSDSVCALNAGTGAVLWSYTTGGYVYSSPAVANGVAYIGSDDGNVYAFGLPRGLPKPETDSERPDPKALHPDFNLTVSQPVATTASAD